MATGDVKNDVKNDVGPGTVPANLVVSLLAATEWTRLVMRGRGEEKVKMKRGSLISYISHLEKPALPLVTRIQPNVVRLKLG